MKKVSEGDTVNSVSYCNKFGSRPGGNNGEKGDTDESTKAWGNCGWIHDPNNCFVCSKTCKNSGRKNYFATLCCSGKRWGPLSTQSIKAVDQEIGPSDNSDEIYVVSDIAAVTLDDEQLVTLQLSSRNYLHFQPDTGAQCNIITSTALKERCKWSWS